MECSVVKCNVVAAKPTSAKVTPLSKSCTAMVDIENECQKVCSYRNLAQKLVVLVVIK